MSRALRETANNARRAPTKRPQKLCRRPPDAWVNPDAAYGDCEVTDAELANAAQMAWDDITRGKKPVGKGRRPHAFVVAGAPGSGKSTVAPALAKARGGDYVTIDTDLAIKYHPRYRGMWVPAEGQAAPAPVGFTMRYARCGDAVAQAVNSVFDAVLAGPDAFNMVLQSHWMPDIVDLKRAGYDVTLVFVGVPLAVAVKRARARAVETGRYLSPTLAEQDEVVERLWERYTITVPWYGRWADEFLVVRNAGESAKPAAAMAAVARKAKTVDLRGGSWAARLAAADKAVAAACAP